MGISGFHKIIREKYPQAFDGTGKNIYEHAYIDINYVLHYCSYKAKTIDELYNRIFKFFDIILQEISPTKSVVIAADGAAPLSKLILQRKRRLNISKNVRKTDEADQTDQVNSLMFTPGTHFMRNVKKKMENYLKYIENAYCVTVSFLGFEVDEAELKLKKKLMDNIEKYNDDKHVFVTNDADVVVMLGTLSKYQNAFIFCRSGMYSYVLSMNKLLELHTKEYGVGKNPGLDFTAINIMLGNDYIPKINYITFDKIWSAYKRALRCAHGSDAGLIIDASMKINTTFLKNMMMIIVLQLKKCYSDKFTLDNAFHPMYENYADGYTWCLHTYYTGECSRYNYMYNHNASPHPFGIVLSIEHDKNLYKLSKINYKCIDHNLYAILILPKSSISLVNDKYKKFVENMNNTGILYDIENCNICDKLKLNKKELREHKKKHEKISFGDIQKIVKKFEEFEKLLSNDK